MSTTKTPEPSKLGPISQFDAQVVAKRLMLNGVPYCTRYEAWIDVGSACMVWAPPGNVEQEANADLFADALNTANRTRCLPSELELQLEKALEEVERRDALIQTLLDGIQKLKEGTVADGFIFAGNDELDRFCESLRSQAADLGYTPTPPVGA